MHTLCIILVGNGIITVPEIVVLLQSYKQWWWHLIFNFWPHCCICHHSGWIFFLEWYFTLHTWNSLKMFFLGTGINDQGVWIARSSTSACFCLEYDHEWRVGGCHCPTRHCYCHCKQNNNKSHSIQSWIGITCRSMKIDIIECLPWTSWRAECYLSLATRKCMVRSYDFITVMAVLLLMNHINTIVIFSIWHKI